MERRLNVATLEQKITELKAQYPVLTYGINDEVYQMSPKQYEQTILDWANASLIEKVEPTVAEKLASVGLSLDELKAALGGN